MLDVKAGRGAFMQTVDDARALARTMVDIGADAGRDVVALISDMNQPLGEAVGNALEVAEAIETLRGGGPHDLREHCLVIAAHMLRLAGRGQRWTSLEDNRLLLSGLIEDGSSLARLRQLVIDQGGDAAVINEPERLPTARLIEMVRAPRAGVVSAVYADVIGQVAFRLGAGREKKGEAVDLAVGLRVHVKVADAVAAGAPLVTIYASDPARFAEAQAALPTAFVIGDAAAPLPLFYDVITAKTR